MWRYHKRSLDALGKNPREREEFREETMCGEHEIFRVS